jgi:hypothetical protein
MSFRTRNPERLEVYKLPIERTRVSLLLGPHGRATIARFIARFVRIKYREPCQQASRVELLARKISELYRSYH